MKTPPLQYTDDEARQLTEAFISGRKLPNLKPRKAPKPETPNVAIELPQSSRSRVAAGREVSANTNRNSRTESNSQKPRSKRQHELTVKQSEN
jgi:hypothetical protein